MDIYAAKITDDSKTVGPVVDFNCWEVEILADDADAREARGESAFIPNPDYVENGGLNLSSDNAAQMFSLMGFALGEDNLFDIEEVQLATMRALNGKAADHTRPVTTSIGAQGATFIDCGIPKGYTHARLGQILGIIAKGRALGATHIAVV
jgi:hypothetical protein